MDTLPHAAQALRTPRGRAMGAGVAAGAPATGPAGPRLPRAGLGWAVAAQREAGDRDAAPAWRALQAGAEMLGRLAARLWPTAGAAAHGRSRVRAGFGAALWRELERARAELAAVAAVGGPAGTGHADRPEVADRAPSQPGQAQLAELRHALARQGLAPRPLARALALAAEAARQHCALAPLDTQLLAAATLLRGDFAEMATGEGKTLAMGLAAAVAGLAGTPVHLLTANDYLAERDEALLRPLFRALGLRSACITSATPGPERALRYRSDVVVSTAREIGFDLLRDHLQQRGERDPRRLRAFALGGAAAGTPGRPRAAGAEPTVPGLWLALLDEADSLLLDEATVPLLLAQPGEPPDLPLLQEAWALAQTLQAARDFELPPGTRRAELTAEGLQRVAARAAAAEAEAAEHTADAAEAAKAAEPGPPPGAGRRSLHRWADAVQAALVARHRLLRDRDYVVASRQGQPAVVLLDEPTGRAAEGRRWQGELTSLVQIKEGLVPDAGPQTVAQMGYPRLFGRYQRLAGLSGTLQDAAGQLRLLYGARVRCIPRDQPSRLRWLGTALLVDDEAHAAAVVAAVRREHGRGRPVLVGTDSVAAAAEASRRLAAAGLPHQRLDAVQDAAEADCIARAGRAGCITVATNIAGRGTDIRLDDAARAAGGLHVIVTQLHRARRTRRQLVGRAARHGDPGSAEALLSLGDRRLAEACPAPLLRAAALVAGRRPAVPRAIALPLLALAQRRHEAADALLRWQLARGEPRRDEWLGFAGPAE